MLTSKPINKIIFIDIETVPQEESFFDLTENKQKLFQWKFKKEYAELGLGRAEHFIQEANTKVGGVFPATQKDLEEKEADDRAKMEVLYNNKASLFAEFGKICCISIGWIDIKEDIQEGMYNLLPEELPFKTKAFYGEDENKILVDFIAATGSIINKKSNQTHYLCGHNATVFDFPFIAKRIIFNGLPLPGMFDFTDAKPWDLVYFIDTKTVWQFNVRDNATQLALLCECFNVPTPKDDIDGSQVRDVYYKEKNIERIAKYCNKDVQALATVYLRMKSMSNTLIT
jgi:hypothetical protein